MFVWAGGIVLWACALAWMADAAASRGRSQIAWIAIAVPLSVVGWLSLAALAVGLALRGGSGGEDDVGAAMVAAFLPFVAALAVPLGLGVCLKRLPVKLRAVRQWPVSCRVNGEGKIEVMGAGVRLIWKDRTQDIARGDVRRAVQDGECLRLEWNDGELLLIPLLAPQTREGRIEQSQQLARMLAPQLPTALQVKP